MFADPLARLCDDPDHSDRELRFLLVGHSFAGRVLLVVHVEHRDTIRIIGARRAKPTLADIQPRIWMLTNGGAPSYPGRLLVTRLPDVTGNGWLYLQLSGLDQGLDAVSWKDGTNQRQKVFYVSGGSVYMLPFDNDTAGTPVLISFGAQALGYTMQSTDLGAVLFYVAGIQQGIAVASGATFGGQSGYICLLESTDAGAHWQNTCSTDRPLPASSNHDIVGVAIGSSTPVFYFQNLFGTLSRARRTGTNTWVYHEELNVPSLVNVSLVAMPSQDSKAGKMTVGFIGTDNLVHAIRIGGADFPLASDWTSLPALPGGATPFTGKTALSEIACCGSTGSSLEKLYLIGTNLGLYQIATTGTGGLWQSSWSGPYFSPSGYVASVGAVTKEAVAGSYQPRVFGAVGYPTYTLQEFAAQTAKFKDYIKFQVWPIGTDGPTEGRSGAEQRSLRARRRYT